MDIDTVNSHLNFLQKEEILDLSIANLQMTK